MNYQPIRLFLTAATLALVGIAPAQADLVDFSYSWTVSSPIIASGTGSVAVAAEVPGSSQATLNAASPVVIPVATITTSSSAVGTPDNFKSPFSLQLTMTDTKSGESGSLTFGGTLSGTLTSTSTTLIAAFQDPLTQALTLGDHNYSVTIDPTVSNLPVPGSTAPTLVDALVKVSPSDLGTPTPTPTPPAHQTPEPSSLVLGSMALASLGWAARRKRGTTAV